MAKPGDCYKKAALGPARGGSCPELEGARRPASACRTLDCARNRIERDELARSHSRPPPDIPDKADAVDVADVVRARHKLTEGEGDGVPTKSILPVSAMLLAYAFAVTGPVRLGCLALRHAASKSVTARPRD